uniref:Uncharacterized protein n=1 Tax=Craspedostauros australis TaxID=1486917 RepID=A0A7R9WPB5_9STRA
MSTDTAVTATATATYVANGEHSGSSSHSSSSSSISAACTQQPTHKKTKSIEAVDSNHAPKAPPSTSQTAKWLEWRQLRVLEETPCAVPITLSRSSLQESWDIGLSKEGNACVVTRVGRGRTIANNDDASVRLFCGDLILHVQNHGTRTETWSPGCPGSKTNLRAPTPSFVALKKFNTGTAAATNGTGSDGDDWFDDLVAIFKQSMELQLIVQRVGVATTVQSTP